MAELKSEVQHLKSAIKDVVSKEFELPISPSHKKFLRVRQFFVIYSLFYCLQGQIIKENGNLVHENLCLQLQVDSMTLEIEKLKQQITRNTTENNLKYINSNTRSSCSDKKEKKVVRINSNTTIIEQKTSMSKLKDPKGKSADTITKIYERKKSDGVPSIVELTTDEPKNLVEPIQKLEEESKLALKYVEGSMALMQVSGSSSQVFCSETGNEPIRTQSAPEIVQSSVFSGSCKLCESEGVEIKSSNYRVVRYLQFEYIWQ